MKNNYSTSLVAKSALAPAILMLATVGYSMLLFALNIPMGIHSAIVPVTIFTIYSVIFDREMLISLAFTLFILFLWTIVCTNTLDWSYDGMYYHKQAAITLGDGWNPLYQSCVEANPLNSHADLKLWLDHYPKGIWICSAAIYIVTGFIESSKAVNILFILILFFTALHTIRCVFDASIKKTIAFSFIICLNPVFISQLPTSYNDLAVGVLVITAVLIGMKIYNECADNFDYALLFCITSLSCIVKFTAPLLVGIMLIAYGVGYLIKTKAKNIISNFKKPFIFILAGFIAGVALFGFDPYIKHLTNGQHLVHPVLGDEKYDIMNTNLPQGFYDKGEASKYFLSLFSKTNNDKEQKYSLKLPFTVYADEFTYLCNADIRLGGFGIFFSGILVLAIALAIFVRVKLKHKMRYELLIGIIIFLALGLFFPESWWARYASYTYYIPVFLIFHTILAKKCKEEVKLRFLSNFIILIVFVNSIISAVFVIKDYGKVTSYMNIMLDEIKAENKKIEIRINDFPSHIKLFEEKGIEFEIADTSIPDAIDFYADTKYRFSD